jgi:putative ABC transport system permease protein
VYGVLVVDALDSAQALAAWRATGAAARIERPAGPPGPVIERLKRVPGVRAVLPALTGNAPLGARGQNATVVAVDLAAYRELLADAPLTAPAAPADVAAPAVPALVTADLSVFSSFEVAWYKRLRVVPKGVITGGLPGLAPERGGLVVVPYQALPRAGLGDLANVLLVDGDDPDPDRLRAAAGGTAVTVVTVRGETRRSPGTRCSPWSSPWWRARTRGPGRCRTCAPSACRRGRRGG